jgi:hypothetical protein
MKTVIRLGVIAALVMMGTSGAGADHDPYSSNAPHPQAGQAASAEPSAQDSDSGQAPTETGAAGMEPKQATAADPGVSSHDEWVESIWNSP